MFNLGGKNDFEVIIIPELRGEEGQTRVTFLNMPVRYSPSRNQKRFVKGDFGSRIVDQMFSRQNFYARHKESFQPFYRCFKCGAQLDETQIQHSIFELNIKHNQFNPFVLKVEAPAVKCSMCAATNAINPDKNNNEILEALLSAFAKQNILP